MRPNSLALAGLRRSCNCCLHDSPIAEERLASPLLSPSTNEEWNMRNGKLSILLMLAAFQAISLPLLADKGSYTYSGGSFSTGTAPGQSITVTTAAMSATGAQLSFSCPITTYGAGTYQINWTCSGGAVSIATPDNSLVFHGSFHTGSMSFAGSGGGRGGHVAYWYSFSGAFSGTVTAGGVTQPVNGSISQYVKTTSQLGSGSAAVSGGSLGWNSAYSPLIVADNANFRIVASDSITGVNLSAYGAAGNGPGHFGNIAGITEDPSGRIYIVDSALDRLSRMDNLTGKNWIQIQGKGTGANHFNSPAGVRIDAAGKVWVADAGNNRIVRMDDMTGASWTSFGTAGVGTNQFSAPSAIAFDAVGRIYVADTGNNRIVRFDDMSGANWVSLTEVLSGPYGYFVTAPSGIEIDTAGNIYFATGGTYGYLMRVSNMIGANAVLSSWSSPLTSISMDKSGTIYVASHLSPGLAEVQDAAATGYFASSFGGAVVQPSVVYAVPTPSPTPPDAVLSLSSLTFANQNVGESSSPQTVSLSNLGSTALAITSIVASLDYKITDNCPASLTAGASCTVSVAFDPKGTGVRISKLIVNSNGVHPSISANMNGTGTAPKLVVLPASLTFDAQLLGSTSPAQIVTLTNTGTGPLTIASITPAGDYSETNNCGTGLPPGSGCTISATFHPTVAGLRSGTIAILDDLTATGAKQIVTLSGTGTATAAQFTVSPESIQFPSQGVGTVTAVQTIVLKNNSTKAASLGTPSYPASFNIATSCGAMLAAGASCVFHVAFAPAIAGPASGVITLPVTGQTSIAIGLSGTGASPGTAPVLAANPASIDFGQITVGDNPSITTTLTNTSGLPAAISSHSLVGAAAFTITQYTCPAILPGKASCTVEITFLPVSTTPFQNDSVLTITEGSGAKTQIAVTAQAVANGN